MTRFGRVLFAGTFVVLSIAAVLPVLRSAYLPLVDLPEHASQVALWRAWPHDPALQRLYTIHPTSPYAGFYWLWRALAACGLGIVRAGNVLVAVCLVLVPLGLLTLLKARQRPVVWSLLAFPFAYTKTLAWGMVPFYFTYALLFFALAIFAMWLRRNTLPWALAATVSGMLLMWEHPLIAGFWGLACGVLTLFESRDWLAKGRAIIPLLPAGLLILAYGGGSSNHGVIAPDFRATWLDWTGAFFLSVYDGTTEALTNTAGLMQPVLALILLAGIFVGRKWKAFDLPVAAVALIAFLLYVFLPFRTFSTDFVNVRFASVCLIVGIAALPPIEWRWLRVGVLAATAIVAVLVDREAAKAYAEFNRTIGDMNAMFSALPAGASVAAPTNAEHTFLPFEIDVLSHFDVWPQVKTLGLAPAFTDREHMLVRDATIQDGPRFDPQLLQAKEGPPTIGGTRFPDALFFYSSGEWPPTLPVDGTTMTYRLVRRAGGMLLYLK